MAEMPHLWLGWLAIMQRGIIGGFRSGKLGQLGNSHGDWARRARRRTCAQDGVLQGLSSAPNSLGSGQATESAPTKINLPGMGNGSGLAASFDR
jgi:hypothetical protein